MINSPGKIALIIGFVGLIVLLFSLPRTPAKQETEIVLSESEQMISRALMLVRGESPMEGIMLLREVLEKDPENIDAHWHLGVFSVESRQFEKAVERFEKVCELDSSLEPKYKEAYFYLGNLYANLGEKEKAIKNFYQLLSLNPNEELKSETEELIEQLELTN